MGFLENDDQESDDLVNDNLENYDLELRPRKRSDDLENNDLFIFAFSLTLYVLNSRFSHDVIKIQTKKLSILLRF